MTLRLFVHDTVRVSPKNSVSLKKTNNLKRLLASESFCSLWSVLYDRASPVHTQIDLQRSCQTVNVFFSLRFNIWCTTYTWQLLCCVKKTLSAVCNDYWWIERARENSVVLCIDANLWLFINLPLNRINIRYLFLMHVLTWLLIIFLYIILFHGNFTMSFFFFFWQTAHYLDQLIINGEHSRSRWRHNK